MLCLWLSSPLHHSGKIFPECLQEMLIALASLGPAQPLGTKGSQSAEGSASSFLWRAAGACCATAEPWLPSCPQAALWCQYPVAQGTVTPLWAVKPPKPSPWQAQHGVRCSPCTAGTTRVSPCWEHGRSHQLCSLCPPEPPRCPCPPLAGKAQCRWLGLVQAAGKAPWLCPCSNCRDKMLLRRLQCHTRQAVTSRPSPSCFLGFFISCFSSLS